MFNLINNFYAIDENEIGNNSEINYTNFSLNLQPKNNSKLSYGALKIDFNFDFDYSVKIIKYLQTFDLDDFYSLYNGKKVMFIISNYSAEIPLALKALLISDKREKYNFVYDEAFSQLDKIWRKTSPCNFCNNKCIASRKHRTAHETDGCCYSFEYSKNPFSLSFLKNIHTCKYLGDDKNCLTQNISCKLFVCKYLKKNSNFNIDYNTCLLLKSFFNKKQSLILKYNFFRTKEEIIDKLLEKNNLPYFLYYLFDSYRI